MTYQEALTKIENYKKKLNVIGAECKFEFEIREDEDGEALVFVIGLFVESEDTIINIPSFVSYIDYAMLYEAYSHDWIEDGDFQDIENYDGEYAICFPPGCAVYSDSKDAYRARDFLSRRTGIMVQEGHPFYASEDGVLFNKEKTVLCLYPAAKEDKHYIVPESVLRVEKNAFQLYETSVLESIYFGKNVADIQLPNDLDVNIRIDVDEENTAYKSVNGSLYRKDGKILYHMHAKEGNSVRIADGTRFIQVSKRRDEIGAVLRRYDELYLPETIEPMYNHWRDDLWELLRGFRFCKKRVPEKLRSYIEKMEEDLDIIISTSIEYY